MGINSIGAGQVVLMFEAVLVDSAVHVRPLTRKLRFEIEYESLWGERFPLVHDFGNF